MFLKIFTLITFLGMVAVNALANILPINNVTTGGISDSYPNLFAPAGITFSIWGLIYILLAIYVVYQFSVTKKETNKVLEKINLYFAISSLANSAWIFSWHYQIISLSVLLMLVILYSLIMISKITNQKLLTLKDKLFLKIPFGVYFGWITIASIANITTFLVSVGWKNFIFQDYVWTVIILFIGMIITSIVTIKEKNLAYGLVPIWAYFGIYLKHTSLAYFNNTYPIITSTTIVCIIIFTTVLFHLLVSKKSF